MANRVDVRRSALALPGSVEGTTHGRASWKVDGKLFLWERPLGAKDLEFLGAGAPRGDTFGLRVADEGEKYALVENSPHIYLTTPHFDGYAAVLFQLDAIDAGEPDEMVTESWRLRAPKRLLRELDGA